MTGQLLSHYRLLEQIGQGGMSVVYRAEDTRLSRTVAVKVLSDRSPEARESRRRFLREAKASAALDHPNICTVYDFGEEGGTAFLAMALIEGPTLKQKIAERPLRVAEAVGHTIQAGEALATAHGHGVVHRDVKPSNLMLTSQGQVKLMDFGLAKLSDETQITASGTVIGTPSYMSPEQARGEAVDRRSDIWSLGVVLYEMVSGRTPFAGDDSTTVLRAILDDDPEPITALRSGIPIELDRILSKAMAKDRRERYQHMEDLLVDLRALEREASSGSARPRSRPGMRAHSNQRRLRWAGWAALAGVAVTGGFLAYRQWGGVAAGRQPMRFISPLPEGYAFTRVDSTASAIAISADGQRIVFSATKDNKTQLFRREIGDFTAQAIPGTEGGVAPFLSRDGRWVGFGTGRAVKRVPYAGGVTDAKELPELLNIDYLFQGGDFDSEGNPIIGQCSRGLRRISMSAESRVLTSVYDQDAFGHHIFPFVMPGGKQILFTRAKPGIRETWLLDRTTGKKKLIIPRGTSARYLAPGYIVYFRDGNLYAAAYDLASSEVRGAEVKLVEGLRSQHMLGLAHWSLSENGTLVYVPGMVSRLRNGLMRVDLSGKEDLLPEMEADPLSVGFRVSPNGRYALEARGWLEDEISLGIHEFDRNIWRKLSPGKQSSYWAVWTPDGRHVVYAQDTDPSSEGGVRHLDLNLFLVPADASRPPEQLTTGEGWRHPGSFTPDGRILAFTQGTSEPTGSTNEIWLLPMDTRKPIRYIASEKGETHPCFSPDGRWLAYASKESSRWQVMIRPFPGPGGATQVSIHGGWEPIWSRDGRRVYFRTVDGKTIYSAAFKAGQSPSVEKPAVVVEGSYKAGNPNGRFYDLMPDGNHFLVIGRPDFGPPVTQYIVILNWVEDLKRLIPLAGPLATSTGGLNALPPGAW